MADDLVEDLLRCVRPTPLERLAGLGDPTGPVAKRVKDYDELTAILAETGKLQTLISSYTRHYGVEPKPWVTTWPQITY